MSSKSGWSKPVHAGCLRPANGFCVARLHFVYIVFLNASMVKYRCVLTPDFFALKMRYTQSVGGPHKSRPRAAQPACPGLDHPDFDDM